MEKLMSRVRGKTSRSRWASKKPAPAPAEMVYSSSSSEKSSSSGRSVSSAPPALPNSTEQLIKKVLPVIEKASPIIEKASPVIERTSPVVEKASPVVEKAPPVAEKASPAGKKASPTRTKTSPNRKKASTVNEKTPTVSKRNKKSSPVIEKTSPVVEEAPPVTKRSSPATKRSSPVIVRTPSVIERASPETTSPVVEEAPSVAEEASPVVEEAPPPPTDPSIKSWRRRSSSLTQHLRKSRPKEQIDPQPPETKPAEPPAPDTRRNQHVDAQPPETKPAEPPAPDNSISIVHLIPGLIAPSHSPTWRPQPNLPTGQWNGGPPSVSPATSSRSRTHQPVDLGLHPQYPTASPRALAAHMAVDENFPERLPTAYVAIGSGPGMRDVVDMFLKYPRGRRAHIKFVSVGVASEHMLAMANLGPIMHLNHVPDGVRIDVFFDTADKVDDECNCIKGQKGSMHLDRLTAMRAEKYICIIDCKQRVTSVVSSGAPIPVEITAESYFYVFHQLRATGATVILRSGEPVSTEPYYTVRGTMMIDVSWPLVTNFVAAAKNTGDMLKMIPGVVDHGLFHGDRWILGCRPITVYVGGPNGRVNKMTPYSSSYS
ncbi:hypothetical protein TWF696_007891 [Orbilia brochopaga]|uniref:Ribose-5-phosphate isomerase n=1 Tax=Orbilia brochopaga TaxID=3140254 RepID=A0AAV9UQ82_9PEZI